MVSLSSSANLLESAQNSRGTATQFARESGENATTVLHSPARLGAA